MKLRNGKTYNFSDIYIKKKLKKIINIDKNMSCCICMCTYSSGELICSCSVKNINKHSFHKKCISTCMNISAPSVHYGGHYKCPYCYGKIRKLKFIKVI